MAECERLSGTRGSLLRVCLFIGPGTLCPPVAMAYNRGEKLLKGLFR